MTKKKEIVEEKPIIKPEKKVLVKKPRPILKKEEPVVEPEPISPTLKKTKIKKVIPIKEDPKIIIKKPTKKQIENEKIDINVPQVVPKKNVGYMIESQTKIKRSEDKYIGLAENAKLEERKIMADKVQKNEVIFSHYAIDNDIGYHYYRVLTK